MRLSLPLAAACAAIFSLSACGGGGSAGGATAVVSSPATLSTTDTVAGTGVQAVTGSRVQISYSGWLYNASATDFKGSLFQSSPAGQPFSFVIGAVGTSDSAITGISQGVQGMKVGGKRTILIPAGMAYGAAGDPPLIPANSGLVFEVQLVKVCAASGC